MSTKKDYRHQGNPDEQRAKVVFVNIIKVIGYILLATILLEYAFAVDDVYIDENGHCVYVIENTIFEKPKMYNNCDEYFPKRRYNNIIIRTQDL